MFRFLNNLFRDIRTTKRARPARRAPRRAMLQVEGLEERLALSTTTPYFQFLRVPTSVQAGTSFTFEIQERGTVTNNAVFAPTSANLFLGVNGATTPLGTIALIDGIGEATVRVTTPETAYLDAVAGPIRGTTSFVVTPGPLTHFAINAPSQATAGTPFQVTVTAEDACGNTFPSDTQVPTLTASAGASVSGFSWANGVGTATVSKATVGSFTLTAAAGSVTNSANVWVIPAVTTHFNLIAPSSTFSSTTFTLTIEARDASGNLVSYFNQTPTITAGYGFPVSVSSVSWSGGRGLAVVTLDSPGTTTLTARVGSVTGTSQNIVVAPGTTFDWAGYVDNTQIGVNAVGGSWVQPADSGPNNADSLIWVGIGGGPIAQCGTKMYTDHGQVKYVGWYELFGDQAPSNTNPNNNPIGPDFYEQYILSGFTVQPGDKISAEVRLVPTTTRSFLFQMTDQPANGGPLEVFSLEQTMQYVTPTRHNAEWIVENDNAPQTPLANFGQVTITGAWAETDATGSQGPTVGSIYNFAGALALDMVNTAGNAVAVPGPAAAPNTLGFLEPAVGVSSAVFTVNWEPGTLPPSSYIPGPATGGHGVGSAGTALAVNAPTAGASSSSSTATSAPANGAAPAAASGLRPATAGSSNLGSTAVVHALFASDAPDNHLGSTVDVDVLFALDGLGSHHRNELPW
jgi:hypothetical protein